MSQRNQSLLATDFSGGMLLNIFAESLLDHVGQRAIVRIGHGLKFLNDICQNTRRNIRAALCWWQQFPWHDGNRTGCIHDVNTHYNYHTVDNVYAFAYSVNHATLPSRCVAGKADLKEAKMNQVEPENFVMPFGKHRGKTLGQILDDDAAYLDWLVGLDNLREPLKSEVEQMNGKYEREIGEAVGEKDGIENIYEDGDFDIKNET